MLISIYLASNQVYILEMYLILKLKSDVFPCVSSSSAYVREEVLSGPNKSNHIASDLSRRNLLIFADLQF